LPDELSNEFEAATRNLQRALSGADKEPSAGRIKSPQRGG